MKNMRIFTKLILSFSVIVIMALILGIVGMVILTFVSDASSEIYQQQLIGITHVSSVIESFEETRINSLKVSVAAFQKDENLLNDSKKQIQENIDKTNESFYAFAEMEKNTELIDSLPEIALYRDLYLEKLDKFVSSCDDVMNGKPADFNQPFTELAASTSAIKEKLHNMLQMKQDLAEKANSDAQRLTDISWIVQTILTVILVLFASFITYSISFGIEKDLKLLIAKLTSSSNIVSTSANQLSAASDSLAQGTAEQAASIEETSTAMNETTAVIKQNYEKIQFVAGLSAAHIKSALKGIHKAEKMIDFMEKLDKSSKEINKIVSTINSIASQTTILALNASVEAVHAGEAGKSFTVVAEEVHNLAQKSTVAAESTTNIVKENMELSEQGVASSKEMVETWQEVKEGAEKAAQFLEEIAISSEQQTQGVNQINIALSQMEKVTQKNAAIAQENAAASSSMEGEINNLDEAVHIAAKLIKNSN